MLSCSAYHWNEGMLGHQPCFDAHALIDRAGVVGARLAATTVIERVSVDIAAGVIGAVSERLYASPVVACIPHRAIAAGNEPWLRSMAGNSYSFQTYGKDRYSDLGLPFGSKARLILLHLIDSAIRAGRPRAKVRSSVRGWMKSMDIPLGGMSYKVIEGQARRIRNCRVRFAPQRGLPLHALVCDFEFEVPGGGKVRIPISNAVGEHGFPEAVCLDEAFFAHVRRDPVCLNGVAVRHLADNCWALDLYIWLAATLPRLERERLVCWQELGLEFASEHTSIRRVKAKLKDTLPLVLAAYPAASVTRTSAGLVLCPSPAPDEHQMRRESRA